MPAQDLSSDGERESVEQPAKVMRIGR